MTHQSETTAELAKALSKAQSQMGTLLKESANPFFRSKYANLAACIEVIRKPFADNGLALVQYTKEGEQDTYLVTQILHASGEWIAGELRLIVPKRDMQTLGASITYARRFGLTAIVCIFHQDEDDGGRMRDDDGNSLLAITPPERPLLETGELTPQQLAEKRYREKLSRGE
jgi:hypothetical protein